MAQSMTSIVCSIIAAAIVFHGRLFFQTIIVASQ